MAKKERTPLDIGVKGSRREQLESVRDYIAHQLEDNMCNACRTSRLRTGDQASLILRLQTVLAELDTLGDANAVDRMAQVMQLHVVPESADDPTKQRRVGTRRPGAGRPRGA